jgi:RNA polymerase sigma factor (sigma-70 family)
MSADSKDLRELMRRYVAGDALAFREIYDVSAPPLHRYLHRLCGTRAAADDLLQQTYFKVHRARSAFVVGADPMPWMYAIAHRTFLDFVRSNKRALVQLTGDGDVASLPATDLTTPANDTAEASMRSDAAISALQQLPEAQRQAVVLTKLEGKSLSDAAEIAGVSLSAMKVRAHRGYLTLRKLLGGAS